MTRRRFNAGSWDPATGAFSRGVWTEATIVGNCQPAPGTNTQVLESGHRAPDSIIIYAPTDTLRNVNQHEGHVADRVWVPVYGALYEVQNVEAHHTSFFSTRHEAAVLQRVDEADSDPGTPPAVP